MACSEAKYNYLLLSGKVTVGILAGCAAKRCFDEGSLFLEVSCFHLLGLGCSLFCQLVRLFITVDAAVGWYPL